MAEEIVGDAERFDKRPCRRLVLARCRRNIGWAGRSSRRLL